MFEVKTRLRRRLTFFPGYRSINFTLGLHWPLLSLDLNSAVFFLLLSCEVFWLSHHDLIVELDLGFLTLLVLGT